MAIYRELESYLGRHGLDTEQALNLIAGHPREVLEGERLGSDPEHVGDRILRAAGHECSSRCKEDVQF